MLLTDLPYLATYTANWVPITAVNLAIAWALATEEQFYLVWPGVEKSLRPEAVLAVLGGVIGFNLLWSFGAFDAYNLLLFGPEWFTFWILGRTFLPISLGVLLAHLLHRPGSYAALYQAIGHRWAPLALLAVLLLLAAYAPIDLRGLPFLAIHLTMALLLASLVIREDHVARRFLAFPPIARLGVISYGLYLYHEWGIHAVRESFEKLGFQDPLAFYLASILASVLIAESSFRLIESPLLRLKSRFEGV